MAHLSEPFSAVLMEEQLSHEDLLQVLRADIAGELEAIINYDAHAKTCNDPRIAQILMHLRDEERQHVGALMTAINLLDPKEASYFEKGRQLVERAVAGQSQQQVNMYSHQSMQGQPMQMQGSTSATQGNQTQYGVNPSMPGQSNQADYNQSYGMSNQHLYQSPNQYSHHDEPM